ncbi:MAG: GNAT family N-acetyltransferase [Candidatus Aenigmarchaeota archaeon]|nr:GNAT family N-acetyltransferase [Candidatus Aenigmarchaeota archaeon]
MIFSKFETKDGKKITIRSIGRNDLKRAKDFLSYINEVVDEDDYLVYDKKCNLKEEHEWLKDMVSKQKKKEGVTIIAEYNGLIIGCSNIISKKYRESHVAVLGISVKKDYREKGLGAHLVDVVVDESKRKLKTPPKIIELMAMETNKRAINLYLNKGFKQAAKLQKRLYRRGKLISSIIMEKHL